MRVSVIGAGVVGKATGRGLSRFGHQVTFYDNNPEATRGLGEEGFRVAAGLEDAVEGQDILMLALPTPSSRGGLDASVVREVARAIAPLLAGQTVMLRSTVMPGTTRSLTRYFDEGRLVFNPEFLREATAEEDFLHQDRRILGYGTSGRPANARLLYESMGSGTEIFEMTWEEAELAKLASNAFHGVKISFFNELRDLAESLRVRHDVVRKALEAEGSIGGRYTAGGGPYGGRCLPKDVAAFASLLEANVGGRTVVDAAIRANEREALKAESTRARKS